MTSVDESLRPLFEPLTIKRLRLKNRIMSTSHAPGYAEGGRPLERYQAYHEEKARGGLALTCFGGSSSVSIDSPAAQWRQISVADDGVIPHLRSFAGRIHRHGAALMCQITHLGHRSRWDAENWLVPIAPSAVREPAHRAFPRAMEASDIARVVADFGAAARRCRDGDLDGVEVIASGAHLIGQFFSPVTNRRTDAYGGSLENRLRFAVEVFESIRREAGEDFVAGLRLTADEMLEGGLDHEACVEVAARLSATGLIDFFTVSTGQNRTALSLAQSIPGMWAERTPYAGMAGDIRRAVRQPVFHAGRVLDLADAAGLVSAGLVDMVGMTRAHIADPHLVRKTVEGRTAEVRPCVGANYCVERLHLGGMSLCLHNAATGRETKLPQVIARAADPRRAVVVGGGPGGLEAARVLAERGHAVTLFEARLHLGGQVAIAARATWRAALAGSVAWFEAELRRLGVVVKLGHLAGAEDVLAAQPDLVVLATGGRPAKGEFPGVELAVSTSDVLAGGGVIDALASGTSVLVFDDHGYNQAPSCAEALLAAGARVELVTPERAIGEEMTGSNYAIHLRNIYGGGGIITPDHRLTGLRRSGNQLAAMLVNVYSGAGTERLVDLVVAEHGTLPETALFEALRPRSRNLGEMDWPALVEGRAQALLHAPDGSFDLFRVGDAVASRDIHAAIHDALRLCYNL
ncbi:MAG TPA: NADH:flavin oxidoreductase [Stellaceae bacterium]|nr:NADH:flavin oxidoreductase [Stellaceae bacterium]